MEKMLNAKTVTLKVNDKEGMEMKIKELARNDRMKVVGVYLNGDLLYTRTYYYDEVGFVEKMITVFRSGEVDVQ